MFRPIFLLIGIYFLGHFWLPLNRGIFWDDWVWVPNPEEALKAAWELGTPFLGQFFYFFLTIKDGIPLFKLVVFLNYLIITIGTFYILVRHKLFSKENAFAICSLIAVLPINNARVSLCTGNYSLSLMLFVLGTILLLENKFWLKICSIIFFTISFFTNSLLVFFIVPIALHYFLIYGYKQKIIEYAKQNWFLLLLPPAFWFYKKALLPTHGLYTTYNQINFGDFFFDSLNWKVLISNATLVPFFQLFNATGIQYFSTIITVVIVLLGISFLISRKNKMTPAVIGILLLFLAAIPYMAVHKLPLFSTWESRHQLLMPFGVALIIFAVSHQLASIFKNSKMHLYFIGVIVALSIAMQWKLYSAYQRDWFKQLALAEAMKKNEILRDNQTFEMHDVSPYWNDPGLLMAFYNYNGLLSIAFDSQTRFAGNSVEIEEFISKPEDLEPFLKFAKRYNMKDYKYTPLQYKVEYQVSENKSWSQLIKALYWEWTNKEDFENYLKNLVTIKTFKK